MASKTPIEQISEIQAQIETLKAAAISELRARRAVLETEIKALDVELEKVTGKPRVQRQPREPGQPRATAIGEGKKPDLQELKALLAAAPNHTISLRKEGYDVRNVKILAQANPHRFAMGGKGPWPTVTLK